MSETPSSTEPRNQVVDLKATDLKVAVTLPEDFLSIPEHRAVAAALAQATVETAKTLAEKQAAANEHSKAVLKEALKEWLDEKFAILGKWSLGTLAVLVIAAVAYFVLTINGWKPPAP